MIQHEGIKSLKDELVKIYKEANAFIIRNSKHIDHFTDRWTLFEENGDLFLNKMPEDEQVVANKLTQQLTKLMTTIIATAKLSPLIDDADQKDLKVNTKKMLATFYFREYKHWDAEIMHDEGHVLGVTPARQNEEYIESKKACKILEDTYKNILKIMELIVPGGTNIMATFSGTQSSSFTKVRPNTAFIMMWINEDRPELEDVKDTIKEVFNSFGIKAMRADEIEHEDVITKRILDEIASCEFLIADLTGERPSVYYEVGYAHAIGKRVILYKKKGTTLHFDLAVHNCPEYENLGDLKKQLNKRLQYMTNKLPNS